MHKTVTMVTLAATAVLLAVACGGSDPTPTPAATSTTPEVVDQEVTVLTTGSLTFEPSDMSVEPGQVVRFIVRNDSSFSHTFTIAVNTTKETILTDVRLAGGQTVTTMVTFPSEPADFYLFCRPHEGAGMHGTIHSGTDPDQTHQDSSSATSDAAAPAEDGYDY